MGSLVLVLVIALVVGALIFGVLALLSGDDPGLVPAEADYALPLPADRPLVEDDLAEVRFDTALRGYRMAQVDRALRRAAYDIGYKDEMISVLEAEISALREGRAEDAELMRKARENALAGVDRGYAVPVEAGGEPAPAGDETEPAEIELADAAVTEAETAEAEAEAAQAAEESAEASESAEAAESAAAGGSAADDAQPVGPRTARA
ncbi:DivIVA domain-containing protein [Luedemannella helvata]|uniref:DivIVA domain-containing protein n=1 Tax=Luedemannella helvata TaxID=349315 RepID=A0ABP4X2T5_9ACTN